MAAELWTPSAEDMYGGREAYVRYIGGVILLHDPECAVAQGIYGDTMRSTDAGTEDVIRQAEDIMYFSLQTIITNANVPERRKPISEAEKFHSHALPYIRRMVEGACEIHAERLDAINPAVRAMRPNPLADPSVYSYLCHSRRYKLSTIRLMDGLMPAPEFAGMLAGRVVHTPAKPGRRKVNGDR